MAIAKSDIADVIRELHGSAEEDFIQLQAGVPTAILDELLTCGLDRRDLELIGSERTLARRRAAGSLTPEEGDRALAIARIVRQAMQVFGDRERARSWLHSPKRFLCGSTPLTAARTIAGAETVRNRLVAIEHGMF